MWPEARIREGPAAVAGVPDGSMLRAVFFGKERPLAPARVHPGRHPVPVRGANPKRILIVNCYFPERREPLRLVDEVPMPLAPVLLAGHFAPRLCEVRLYNEISDGFLELHHPELLAWPDVLVFGGLTPAFDRMLHLSAYARTLNPRVITVAGGLAIRTLPRYSRQFFDYACLGDVEDVRGVIADALGPEYVADDPVPRYDLAPWIGRWVGYVESSRNCNFRCDFCTLTADARPYEPVSLDDFRKQIVALGRRELIHIQDNQFAGPDHRFFLDRVALLRVLRGRGHFRHWSGFVTDAFMWEDENLRLARESGCFSLLVGVESFDETWLRRVNKPQNLRRPQRDLIRRCLEAGILFQYGLVFDPTERTVAEMHQELEAIVEDPEVPAPNFIFIAIPVPGTPFFRNRWERGLLLPGTKVRDLEGSTLSMRPIDDIESVAGFLGGAKNLRGYRRRFVRHQVRFLWRYRHSLSAAQSLASTVCVGSIMAPAALSNRRYLFRRRQPRTYVSTTDRLDRVYRPSLPVAAAYAHYFAPTMVTDAAGALNEALADDLLDDRYRWRGKGVPVPLAPSA